MIICNYGKTPTRVCFISVIMDPLGFLTLRDGTDLINKLIGSLQSH